MNKIYRVVYNEATQTYTAVAEDARAKGKSGRSAVVSSSADRPSTSGQLLRLSLVSSALLMAAQAHAATGTDLPAGVSAADGSDAYYCYYHTDWDTVICGDGSTTNGTASNGVVLGKTAQMTGNSAIAIGNGTVSAVNAVSIGRDAKATNRSDIAIGNNAGNGLNDKGANRDAALGGVAFGTGAVSFVGGSTFTKGVAGGVPNIATHTNVSIGIDAGRNATGIQNINIGKSAGTQHFGEDSVTIGTNANNFNSAKNVDGSALAVGDTFRARRTVAIGNGAMTYGEQSIAIGNGASTKQVSYNNGANYTTAENAIALGTNSRAAGNYSIAQGANATAQGVNDIVMGSNARAEINPTAGNRANGIAIGTDAKVGPLTGGNTIAIGTGAKVLAGNNSTALGASSQTIGNNLNVALGNSNRTWGDRANAIGNSSTAGGFDSVAVGAQSHVMMQYNTNANPSNNGVAVGAASLAGNAYSVAVGNAVAVFGQNSGAFSASSRTANADTIFTQGNTATNNTGGQASIIGGDNNFAIGNANVIGTTSNDNMVMGNRIAVGATNATMSGTITLYRLAIRDTATGQTTISSTAYIKDGNNYYAYNKDAAGYKGAQLDLTGKNVTDAVTFTHIIPTFNNTKSVNRSVAIGKGASVADNDTIAIGTGAIAGDAAKAANATANAIAIGNGAQALAKNSISVGTGNVVTGEGSGAFGDPTTISGTGSYSTGNNNTITTNDTFVVGSNVVTTAANSVFLGKDAAYVTQGTSSDGLGTVSNATVGGITYAGTSFAGQTPVGVVSVGAVGAERRIQNVAAGLINATSTDAINGSQLYAVASTLGEQVENTYFHTNTGANAGTGNATTNLGKITDAAGATGAGAVTAGVNATANTLNSIAIGQDATVQAVNGVASTSAIAIGHAANIAADNADRAIAIGNNAKVLDNAEGSVVVGDKAQANGQSTVALGESASTEGLRSVAIGTEAQATNTYAVALGQNAQATAVNAMALGSSAYANAQNAVAVGPSSQATASLASAFGSNAAAGATQATALGSNATASGAASTAVGRTAASSATNSTAVGARANASIANSVALGADAVTTAKGTTTNGIGAVTDPVTVNGVSYGDFAGKTSVGVVSVGAVGAERRIQNVAAGLISPTSTDAINGSQLYLVASGLTDQMPVIYTDTDGNKVYKQPNGSFVDSTGAPYTGDVIASMNDGDNVADSPKTLANVNDNLTPTYNTGDMTIDPVTGKPTNTAATGPTTAQTGPSVADAADMYNNAATVGDVLNAGWNLQGNGVAKDFVKPYDTVNFINGAGTTAKVETAADGKSSTVTYDVNVDGKTIKINNNGQLYADIATPAAPKNTFHTNNSATPVAASGTNNIDSVDGVGSATGGYSLAAGLNAQATAYRAQAVGQAAEAHGSYAVADGFLTKANRENAVAIGNSSVAGLAPTATVTTYDARGGVNTVAIGNSAQAMTSQSIAIGNNAKVNPVYHGDDANNTFNTSNLYAAGIAIGNIAETEGLDSIAVGSLTKAQSDVAIAIGRATQITGFNSTGIGTANTISGTSSVAVGSSNTVATKDTFVLGSNVVTTADNSVFLGKEAAYTAKGTSTDGIGAVTDPVTVSGVSYGDFAGKTSVGVVSVGAVGAERRVQNVAAGLISATSTDAINGSQLYLVASGLTDQMPVIYTDTDGNKVYKQPDGSFVDSTGAPYTGDVIASMNDGDNVADSPQTLANVNGNLTPTYNTGDMTIDSATGKPTTTAATAPTTSQTGPKAEDAAKIYNNAATVGDVLNAGWNLQGNGVAKDFVKPYDTVNFINGAGTTAKVVTKDDGTSSTVTYDVNVDGKTTILTYKLGNESVTYNAATNTYTKADGTSLTPDEAAKVVSQVTANSQAVTNNSQLPVVYTDEKGTQVYPIIDANGDVTYNTSPDGTGTKVDKGDVITSINGPDGTTTPTTLTNVAGNLPNTYNTDVYNTTGQPVSTSQDLPTGLNVNNAATVGDILNSGWNLQGNGTAKDFVKPYDTVNFINGAGTTAKVETAADGKSSTVTYDVNVDNSTIKINNNGQLYADIAAPTTGSITTNPDGTVNAPNTGFATTTDVANAINNSGFTVAGNGTAQDVVKPGDKLDFVNGTGTNVTVKSDGVNTTVKVDTPISYVDSSGNQTNTPSNTVTYVGNAPVQVTNVASGVRDAAPVADVKAPTAAEQAAIADAISNAKGDTLSNAVNVGDLQAVAQNITNNITNNATNINNINNIVGKTDSAKGVVTYNVQDQGERWNNTLVEAIDRMNQQGIQFFHTNQTGVKIETPSGYNTIDSSAAGGYSTAIGVKAVAGGESALAIGHGSQALGAQSIAIGTGNVVRGNNSGAFGDLNTVSSNNTFVLGNNVTQTADNSVALGNNTAITAGSAIGTAVLTSSGTAGATTTAGTTGTVNSATVNGTTYSGFAGATANGAVSVGASGSERRIQNVAAGEISATSTDAINGSQLYSVAKAISSSSPVQYSDAETPTTANGGNPTNNVTLVGADSNAPVTIHNVAPGVYGTDAVNVNQLNQGLNNLNNRINDVADDADAGTASAMAAAGLPQAYLPGKSMVAVAGSTYRGKQGYAVGFSAITDGGNWIIKGIINGNSRGHIGGSIGAGYQW